MSESFFLTFGKRGLRDGWVHIIAKDYADAREWVVSEFGSVWSDLYTAESFEPSFFPRGEHGEVKVS